MIFFLILVYVVAATMAQRPTYAGIGPKDRPGLASRFKDPTESPSVTVYNRFAEDGTTARIPVDARGDGQLVDRLNQWPREHRPFWLLNADHIEASRGSSPNSEGSSRSSVLQQGSPDNIQGGDLESRSGFNTEPGLALSETRPIRPNQPRSSFLGPLN